MNEKRTFSHVPAHPKPKTLCLWTRSYFGQTGEKPLQTINLEKGWVNAVIEKPRKYFVIENTAPGTPVFDKEANWLGIVVYKMDRGRPSSIVTLPADDIDEIAEQVRSRNQ